MSTKPDSGSPGTARIPQTRPTGLARGKATRKKNPGKRAKQGGG
jgi:hypothetical protein